MTLSGKSAIIGRSTRGRPSWPALLLLACGWFAQLPLVHQIPLASHKVKHIWCPRHQRIEHLDAGYYGVQFLAAERPGASAAIYARTTRITHRACPLGQMHRSLAPLVADDLTQARLPDGRAAGVCEDPLLGKDILRYAPKLSPPSSE